MLATGVVSRMSHTHFFFRRLEIAFVGGRRKAALAVGRRVDRAALLYCREPARFRPLFAAETIRPSHWLMMRATISTDRRPRNRSAISNHRAFGILCGGGWRRPAARLPTRLKMQTSKALRKNPIISLSVSFLLTLRICFQKIPSLSLQPRLRSFRRTALGPIMKLAHIAAPASFFWTVAASAQDVGKTISRPLSSWAPRRPGAASLLYCNAFAEVMMPPLRHYRIEPLHTNCFQREHPLL